MGRIARVPVVSFIPFRSNLRKAAEERQLRKIIMCFLLSAFTSFSWGGRAWKNGRSDLLYPFFQPGLPGLVVMLEIWGCGGGDGGRGDAQGAGGVAAGHPAARCGGVAA